MRKTFTPKQKAEVALAAIKNEQTINQLSSAYEIPPKLPTGKRSFLIRCPKYFPTSETRKIRPRTN